MRGRQPMPVKLKVLLGTQKPERRNYREPFPATNIAEPPEWLTAEQRLEWIFVIANAPPGLLKQLDRALLAAWVCSADTYRRAAVQLAKQRDLLGKRAAGYLAIRNKEAIRLKSLATELGFSPAARPRIQVTPDPDAKASELEKLMG